MDNIKIILAVIVVVALGGGAYYGYTILLEQEQAKQQQDAKAKADQQAMEQKQAADAALTARTKCTDAGNYSVVTLDHNNSAVGQDILVKKKVDGNGNQACKYEVADGDFQLQNADAQYFKTILANAMIVDVGTAPTGRSFRLYDLGDKSMVTEKPYFGDLTIGSTTLSYFGTAKTKIKNCTGDSVVDKTIDLKTYGVKEGKTTKCVTAQ